mgnify:CR=1 FL=1
MKADIYINNLPETISRKYIVVRRCDDDGKVSLWYYGQYSDRDKALDVALEIGNGFVVEVVDHDEADNPA